MILFGWSVLWGILARVSGSLIPVIISHAVTDIINFSSRWTDVAGAFDKRPVGETGIDTHFVMWMAVYVASLALFGLAACKTLRGRSQLNSVAQGTPHARGRRKKPIHYASLILVSVLTLILYACSRTTGTPPVTITAPSVTSEPPIWSTRPPAEFETSTYTVATTLPATPKPTSSPPVPGTSTPTLSVVAPALETPASTPLPATIYSFDIYPAQVVPGKPITLSWRVIAESVLINKLDYKGRLVEPAYTVPLSGTLVMTDYHQQGNRTGFMLSACSRGLCDNATVSAEFICTNEWFFSYPPPDCPAIPSKTIVVAQHFEYGLMLWLGAADWRVKDEIVILYGDDPVERPRWEMMVDNWDSSMLEEDPEIVPPSGYYEPVRGFGKAWREASGVRERLGWATDKEFVVGNGAFQCAQMAYGRCYVTGPDSAVYVLEPEMSGWFIEPEPPPEPTSTPGASPTDTPQPTFMPVDAPEIVSFSASPRPADPTGTVTLVWHVRGASSVTVQWLDKQMEHMAHSDLALSGSLSVVLSQVRFTDGNKVQFSLSAHDANGRLMFDQNGNAIANIIRVPLLTDMNIDSFSASPDPVERGGTVTLSWNAPNADFVGITRLNPEGIFLPTEAPNLPASGTIGLQVPEDYATSITYYLGARDANGVMLGRYVTVSVICPYDEYIAISCPLTHDYVMAAYAAFEGGHMVWRADTREIYVLYHDGSYETYEDTWNEGEPIDTEETPPPGLLLPTRGFGKLWGTQRSVRDRLGWATDREIGYTMLIETSRTSFGRYPATHTFLTLPDNRVVQLSGYSKNWDVLQ